MISCTQFIPMYSEFFKYLEKRGGYDEVLKYWYYISDNSIGDKTNPNSLISFIERDGGFEGAVNYWNHTLTEEACDILKIHDYSKRYSYNHMRHCPSRGMLNALKHVEPYYDYCSHCKVIYSRVLEKYGISYIRDNSKIENAECTSMLYETKNPPDFDFRQLNSTNAKEFFDEKSQIVDMKTEDNKYLHRDFHLLGDNALQYCANKYGKDAVKELKKFKDKDLIKVVTGIRRCGKSTLLEIYKKYLKDISYLERSTTSTSDKSYIAFKTRYLNILIGDTAFLPLSRQ